MKKNLQILILLLNAFVILTNVYAKSESIINTPNEIAAPKSRYKLLLVLNAQRGKLIKEDNIHYKLILINVHETINASFDSTQENNDLWPLTEFIKKWNGIHSKKVTSNVTGIQIDKRIGHTQFYATFLLNNPTYNPIVHELTFNATLVNPTLNIDKVATFDNATIYINGCELCICNNKIDFSLIYQTCG